MQDGEYWITDLSEVIYCDGDAGVDVPNHASVIIRKSAENVFAACENSGTALGQDMASVIGRHLAEGEDEVIDTISLCEDINNAIDDWFSRGRITEEQLDDIYTAVAETCDVDYRELMAATGNLDDPRELGIDWGWVRVQGSSMYVKVLSLAACQLMSDFVEEYEFMKQTWDVEVRDPERRVYWGVPAVWLGSPSDIREAAAVS